MSKELLEKMLEECHKSFNRKPVTLEKQANISIEQINQVTVNMREIAKRTEQSLEKNKQHIELLSKRALYKKKR